MFNFCVLTFAILLSATDTLQQNPFQCGITRVDKTKLIVHGHDAAPGAWPWHVAIYHKNKRANSYACGGTLISDQFVLTAAHCVLDSGNGQQLVNDRIFVRLGLNDLDDLDINTFQHHKIYKIHQHSDHKGGNDLRNDIAILQLSTVARLNDYVQPACLSVTKDLTGEYGTAVGWGFTESDEISQTLKTVRLPVVDAITCLKSDRTGFGETLDEGIFCAGYTNGTAVCNGDSGGGLFFKVDNAWHLGGIVSYAVSRDIDSNICHTKSYGAFTKVYTYLPWISSITELKFQNSEEQMSTDGLGPGICKAKDVNPSKTYTTQFLPQDCGIYITNRIARGSKTDVFEFPWMAIFFNSKNRFCHGSLINKRYILTSAACALTKDKQSFIRLGEHTWFQDKDCNLVDGHSDCAPPVRDYGIQCILTHQNYNEQTALHNIALIRLDRDIQFETHIQPICLPVANSLRKFYPQQYIMTGWGDTELGDMESSLLKGIVTPADRSECQKWVNKTGGVLDQSQLCVGQRDEPSLCNGDAGAPLGYSSWYNGMRFIQFGIGSYYDSNCESFTIYTNVAYYMKWIIANMEP